MGMQASRCDARAHSDVGSTKPIGEHPPAESRLLFARYGRVGATKKEHGVFLFYFTLLNISKPNISIIIPSLNSLPFSISSSEAKEWTSEILYSNARYSVVPPSFNCIGIGNNKTSAKIILKIIKVFFFERIPPLLILNSYKSLRPARHTAHFLGVLRDP